ncbi:MAG: glycosyltransferase family 25 protein [Acinetobacter sp.]
MKVFIISIEEENSPRLNNFLSQPFFQSLTQQYKKIGIKGAELSAKFYFEKAVKGREQALTPGELGCTLSHLQALEEFLESDDSYAFILEDDAILPKDLTNGMLQQELSRIKLPPKTLLSLGGIQMKESRKVRGKFVQDQFLGKKVLEVIPDFYHRVNYAMAYIVDREMAALLLVYHQPLRRADDWSYLFDFDHQVHLMMTYLVDHPVIQKGESNQRLSAIEAERVDNSPLLKSKYGTGLRKNFSKLFSNLYFN